MPCFWCFSCFSRNQCIISWVSRVSDEWNTNSIHKMEMFLDRFFNTLWHYLKFEKTYNENIHMHDRSYAAMQRKKVHFRNFSCCSHTHNTLIPNTQHKKVLLPLLTKSIFHQNDFKCNFMLHLHFAVCPNPINQTLISPPLYCKLKWHPSNTSRVRGAQFVDHQ